MYRDSQRVAAVQVGDVKSAVLVDSKLFLVNDTGVLLLETTTLETTPTRMAGGSHIDAVDGYIVVGGESALNIYFNGALVKCMDFNGQIGDVTLSSDSNGGVIMLVSVVTTSTVINNAYKLIGDEITHISDNSPGFGYPLITGTCLNVADNALVKYIQSSMEGKVSISDINGSDSFVFRPHRITLTDKSLLAQPVFSIANLGKVLVTGGDGVLGIWDINTKKRTSQIRNLNGVVTAIAMTTDKIVVAVCDGGVKNSDLSEDLKLVESQLFEMKY